MNGTTLERPDVAAYLAAVRAKLADLPAEERDDLVADVEASLLESGEPPALAPDAFAAELREAAGLTSETPAAAQPSALDALRAWLSSERVASWRRTAHELAPIWWVARAFVAVGVLDSVSDGYPLGSETGGTVSLDYSLVVLLAAAAASIWLGLRGRRGRGPDRRISLAVNVALALALLPVAAITIDKLDYGYSNMVVYYEPTQGLAVSGTPIRNVYPYSRDGEPLFDVLLYDENGLPVEILSGPEDTSRRLLSGPDGTHLFNSFPIRYFEPGTSIVARPELGPPVTVPRIVTPELERP